MNKEKTIAANPSFWSDLFQTGIYKRSQGRTVRQVTFAAIFLLLLLAAWKLFETLEGAKGTSWYTNGLEYAVPATLLGLGMWLSFRLVNYPQFADFLISVEAEMNKVSWPSKTELIRSSMVVIFLMFFLALILFGFDLFWQFLFQAIGVLQRSGPPAN